MLGKTTKDREGARPERPATSSGGGDLSVISKDMRIDGDCYTEGLLRVEGTIQGDVVANGVELTASGSVDGDVRAIDEDKGHPFIIGGEVTGAVQASRVEVRNGGSIQGGLATKEAVIQGKVLGGVVAKGRLALDETAVVEGDVLAQRLSLKEGGQVNGNIRMGEAAAKKTADIAPGGQSASRGSEAGTGSDDDRDTTTAELARAAS